MLANFSSSLSLEVLSSPYKLSKYGHISDRMLASTPCTDKGNVRYIIASILQLPPEIRIYS
jgi:hypothetical protein